MSAPASRGARGVSCPPRRSPAKRLLGDAVRGCWWWSRIPDLRGPTRPPRCASRKSRLAIELELAADRVADSLGELLAKLDRIADWLSARRQIRKRHRGLAIGKRDGTRSADARQCAGELDGHGILRLCEGRPRLQQRDQRPNAE